MRLLLFYTLLPLVLFWSCNSEKRASSYYQKNKTDLSRILTISRKLVDELEFESLTVRGSDKDIGIRVLVLGLSPNKSIGGYYGWESFELTSSSINDEQCRDCNNEEREKYKNLRESLLKDILRLYVKTKPRAIKITPKGVFFALGTPFNHPSWSDMEGGVFIPSGNDFNRTTVVKKIEGENAYLYNERLD